MLCLAVRENPYAMLKNTQDKYSFSSTATKVELQTKFSTMNYGGESMKDFVEDFEQTFNQWEAIESKVA